MIGKGRRKIVDDREITKETIVPILMDAMNYHRLNRDDEQYLIDYWLGFQTILKRPSNQNSDINNKTVLNYAYSSIRDIIGYTFGKPIQIIPRKTKFRKEIQKLSDMFEYENSYTVDNEVALYSGITGLGYFEVLPNEEMSSEYMPDVPIMINHLDPRTTFVIESSKAGNPVRLSCTYSIDKKQKMTTFIAYTDKEIYTITSKTLGSLSGNNYEIKVEANPIGLNPIIRVKNNLFMVGDFEVAISVLDAINQMASDSLNDVENVIKSLLIIINAELNHENTEKVKKNRILELVAPQGVSNTDAKFIYQQLDAISSQNLRQYLEEAYKIIIGIPDRKTRGGGGGDTGDAVKLRDGWADIEIVARNKESYFKIAKKKQLAVAIAILKKANLITNNLKTIDTDVKFTRNKNDNLQTKAQSYSTIIGTKTISPEDALEIADMTTDVVEVIDRGKKYWDGIAEENIARQQELNKSTEKPEDNISVTNPEKSAANKKIDSIKDIKDIKDVKDVIDKKGSTASEKKSGTNFTNNKNKISEKK